jgi:hypothetical protein
MPLGPPSERTGLGQLARTMESARAVQLTCMGLTNSVMTVNGCLHSEAFTEQSASYPSELRAWGGAMQLTEVQMSLMQGSHLTHQLLFSRSGSVWRQTDEWLSNSVIAA